MVSTILGKFHVTCLMVIICCFLPLKKLDGGLRVCDLNSSFCLNASVRQSTFGYLYRHATLNLDQKCTKFHGKFLSPT